ncbi:similar to An01g12260 [Aspergillus luchuensis]|uniref:Similar to An01g12260 n=1 Tax=Aspergillus kawachii TaxID=1069201 RepID=A0A146FBE6_ASPKA|nr:similar to An01g12260 [Aspergillus luchuensis]
MKLTITLLLLGVVSTVNGYVCFFEQASHDQRTATRPAATATTVTSPLMFNPAWKRTVPAKMAPSTNGADLSAHPAQPQAVPPQLRHPLALVPAAPDSAKALSQALVSALPSPGLQLSP